jgi:phosphate-selective porin OprO and OprP
MFNFSSCISTYALNTLFFFCKGSFLPLSFLILFFLLLRPSISKGQDTTIMTTDSTLVNRIEAGYSALEEPRRQLVKWNEYKGPYFTLRLGGGLLYEGATYSQGPDAEEQVDPKSDTGFRDFRFQFKGRLGRENPKRQVTYTVSVMYDGPTETWLFRETGLMFAIPELWGHVFVGRTKEGFSLNKVMVGYAGWTMERATISDATVPILGDGVKWLGYLPEQKILWNIGYFLTNLTRTRHFRPTPGRWLHDLCGCQNYRRPNVSFSILD